MNKVIAYLRNIDTEQKLILLIILLGFCIRFPFVINSDFPLNDGGMFYTMVTDLLYNHLVIPNSTTYNFSNIPFAYPPLGLYLAAVLHKFGLSLIFIFRFLPLLFSLLLIPLTYVLCKDLVNNKYYALTATMVFVLLPRSFEWIIMGGGITRGIGYICALITIISFLRFTVQKKQTHIFIAVIFFALTILSHLEMLVFTMYTLFLIYCFFDASKKGFINLIFVFMGGFIFSAPWWLYIITIHGFSPFNAAMRTGGNLFIYAPYLLLNFTEEQLLPIFMFSSLLGLIKRLYKKELFYLLWIVGTIIISPRGSPNFVIIPLSLAAAIGVYEVILPGLNFNNTDKKYIYLLLCMCVIFIEVISIIILFINTNPMLFGVSKEDRTAFQWIQKHTNKTSTFLVLTPKDADWGRNRTAEWFPVLAQRKSVNTLQGKEWLPNNEFAHWDNVNIALFKCIPQQISCIEELSKRNKINYNYIYISYKDVYDDYNSIFLPLRLSIVSSSHYILKYRYHTIEIWQYKQVQ